MAVAKNTQVRNYLNEYLKLAMERCDRAKAKFFARLTMEYFENLAIVTITVADKQQIACFVDDMPVFTYWLTREQRIPLIGRMYKQGISGVKIAAFLKLAPATIYRDLSYIREVSPFKIENRIERKDVKKGRIIPEGDFKLAALNFKAQVLDMQRAFAESKTATMQ
jgi:hypothetical protein